MADIKIKKFNSEGEIESIESHVWTSQELNQFIDSSGYNEIELISLDKHKLQFMSSSGHDEEFSYEFTIKGITSEIEKFIKEFQFDYRISWMPVSEFILYPKIQIKHKATQKLYWVTNVKDTECTLCGTDGEVLNLLNNIVLEKFQKI